jgi:DNA-directed RNA polymerase specialized sigma24 family protein
VAGGAALSKRKTSKSHGRRSRTDAGASSPGARETDAFYRDFFLPLVRRAIWRHGLSSDDARDIVQDAFLIALEKMNSARRPEAWLVQVVDYLALNHRRKTARRSRLLARWSPRDRPRQGEEDQE